MKKTKALLFLVIVLVAFSAARYWNLGDQIARLSEWIDGLGFWGPGAYILIYVVAVVLAIPGSAVTLLAGALFGALWGTIYVSVASTLGASLAFLIARYFARDMAQQWLSQKESFAKLDIMTEEKGPFIVAITRLVPIFPFNLLNYGFGLTRVSFFHYVIFSWLFMLPGTLVYVVGADTVVQGLKTGSVPWVMIGLLLGMILLLTGITIWIRKKHLRS